jgi:hypothetical protein
MVICVNENVCRLQQTKITFIFVSTICLINWACVLAMHEIFIDHLKLNVSCKQFSSICKAEHSKTKSMAIYQSTPASLEYKHSKSMLSNLCYQIFVFWIHFHNILFPINTCIIYFSFFIIVHCKISCCSIYSPRERFLTCTTSIWGLLLLYVSSFPTYLI